MKKYSLETWALILLPSVGTLVIVSAAFFYTHASFSFFETIIQSAQSFLVYFKFKTIIFFLPFLIIFFLITFFFLGSEILLALLFEHDVVARNIVIKRFIFFLKELGKMCVKILLPLIFISTTVGAMTFWIPYEKVAWASVWLMEADHTLFTIYPTSWFQDSANFLKSFFDYTAPVFFIAYNLVIPMITITLLIFLFFDARKLKLFILSFFFTTYLAIPIWFFFPAVTPNDAFLNTNAKIIVPQSENMRINLERYTPNAKLKKIIEKLGNTDTVPSITTFPSMHVAWGFLIALMLFTWSPFVGFIVFIWEAINIFATMYTMQHYALDTPAGIFVALLGYYIAKKILQYDTFLPNMPSLTTFIQENFKKIISMFRIHPPIFSLDKKFHKNDL